MKNKSKFILVSLILLCLIVSAGAAYADDLDTIEDGEVSGGVDVVASNPGAESGELSYDIPEDVKDVQYAGLYVDLNKLQMKGLFQLKVVRMVLYMPSMTTLPNVMRIII